MCDKLDVNKIKLRILFYYFNFIIFIIDIGLFVYCFINETNINAYIYLISLLILFIVLYSIAVKLILHKGKFTYIQAISFYKTVTKNNNQINEDVLYEFAKKTDFATKYEINDLWELYKVGETLTNSYK